MQKMFHAMLPTLRSLLTATGDIIVASAPNVPARLPIGTARQELLVNAAANGLIWASSIHSLLTAAGDLIIAASANNPARLAVGTERQILQVISGTPAWATPPACRVTNSANQAIPDVSVQAITFNQETYDTAGMHDNATNNTRLTAPIAGKYLFIAHLWFETNSTGNRQIKITHSGGSDLATNWYQATTTGQPQSLSVQTIASMAASEYVECKVYQDSGASRNVIGGTGSYTAAFMGQWLGP